MPTHQQILPDVYEIAVRFLAAPWITRAYLVTREAPRSLLLVDTGSAGSETRILACIRAAGHEPTDLQAIVITHWHEDHTGALGALLDVAPQAIVYAGPADAAILREQKPRIIREDGVLGKSIGGQMNHAPGKLTPAHLGRIHDLTPDSTALADWDLRVLIVPGHSPGSIALHSPGRRALFSGDALGGRDRVLFTFMTYDDREQMDATARQLLELDFDTLLPGHCHTIRDAGLARRRPMGRLTWTERVVMERALGLKLLLRV
jgi:glyoxylase-like metal-dependent hydrolase (beta-lactamase superfamily II)